ncbi:hypothetical protein [Quadrisphaera setariae]|uniref:AAA-like domain-containing protein n=1 Tax=Quadrisphaera setariae TaxID=2593304 RepID=A0A5C8ZG88_9ACTN|nr:hypothetical protein [Quadrisphaera setariae]TXR56299.1 hypothetical protein FMM08_09255 [Quadrisphaera setariae]
MSSDAPVRVHVGSAVRRPAAPVSRATPPRPSAAGTADEAAAPPPLPTWDEIVTGGAAGPAAPPRHARRHPTPVSRAVAAAARAVDAAWDGVARAAAAAAYRRREPGDGTPPRPPVPAGTSLPPTLEEDRRARRASAVLGFGDYAAPPVRSDLYGLKPLFPYAHARAWDSPRGVLVGYDVHTGEPVRHSGRAWFDHGTSGSSTLVLGSKFAGKSALLKSYLVRAVAEHGFRAWVYDTRAVNHVDGERRVSEGEFCALGREAGGAVHRFAAGGPLRLNLLDARLHGGDGGDVGERAGREGLVRSVLQFLAGRRLTPAEGYALRVQLDRTLRSPALAGRQATVVDLREALLSAPADPDEPVVEAPGAPGPTGRAGTSLTEGELHAWGRDLGLLLDRLVFGDLAGFVDGPTSPELDLDADVVVWDLSGVQATHPDVVPVLMAASAALMLTTWTAPGRGWGVVVVDELWNAVRVPELGAVVQEVVKKARTLGVELLGATQHLTDVLAAQESGRSFVHDADVVVSFRQEPVNARVFGEQLGFTEVEVAALEALGAHQAVWKVPGEPARAVQHVLYGVERRLTDTAQRLR